MNPATLRTLFLTAVGALVLWLAYLARAVVTPLLVALVLAYILDPVVRWLERRGLSRGAASGLVVVVALASIVSVVAVAATRFASEAGALYDDVVGEPDADLGAREAFEKSLTAGESREAEAARIRGLVRVIPRDGVSRIYFDRNGNGRFDPGYAQQAVEKIGAAAKDTLWQKPIEDGVRGLGEFGPKVMESAQSFLLGLAKGGQDLVFGLLGIVTLSILFPIYLYYSLVNLARVYDVTVGHLPLGQRPRIVEILHKIHVTVSAFFRGRLITMLVKGAMLYVLFAAFGVPFSVLCAAFAAVASLVPLVGGIAAAVPPVLLALPSSTGGEIAGLVIGVFVVEAIEGYVLIPALVGRSVGLHPLTVLVCTLVAYELLGFFGMIVAVPLTAVVKILAAEFVLPEVRRRAGLAPRPADLPPAPVAADSNPPGPAQ